MIKIAEEMRGKTQLPLLIQPNAGIPIIEKHKTVYKLSPIEFARTANELVKIGINFIGGCCGTTSDHIKETVKLIKG